MDFKQTDCIEFVELVTDCLEEALDNKTLLSVFDHLQICKGCDDYFKQMLVTLKVLAHLRAPALSAEFEASLLAVHGEWVESRLRHERVGSARPAQR